ncbi:MAG: GatB/YqeY domain-containing protein [Pseudomonadales bacterium]
MSSQLKLQIEAEVKDAMRARAKQRLGVLRLTMAELKRVEIDERIELDDDRVLVILDKMSKQRRDSLTQYEAAGRDDLAAQESFELTLLKEFMPEQLSSDELKSLVDDAMKEVGASTIRDMGKVMGILKPKVQGRADMGEVGGLVKAALA